MLWIHKCRSITLIHYFISCLCFATVQLARFPIVTKTSPLILKVLQFCCISRCLELLSATISEPACLLPITISSPPVALEEDPALPASAAGLLGWAADSSSALLRMPTVLVKILGHYPTMKKHNKRWTSLNLGQEFILASSDIYRLRNKCSQPGACSII